MKRSRDKDLSCRAFPVLAVSEKEENYNHKQNVSYFKAEEMSVLKWHYFNRRDLQEQKWIQWCIPRELGTHNQSATDML